MNEKLQRESGLRGAVGSMGVSAIVFNSGADRSIQRTLTTLHKQTFTDFETIIVDESRGESGRLDPLIKDWPQTIVMRSEDGISYGRACNLAARSALGKYLLFLDTNAWLNKTAINELVEALESEPGAGVAGPLILNANGSLQSIGMNINQFGRPRANLVPFEADTELIENVFFVPGSVLMIERQLFNSLNGFDELYVRGLEDADLCWRARLLGKKIVVNPWSIAYFEPGENRDGDGYLKHRNSLRMIIKNYGARKALSGGAHFVRATVVKSFKSLLYLKPRAFSQYWRALFWNLAILPDSMRQRRRVQRRRRLNDQSVLKHILIDKEKPSDFTSDRAA